MTIDDYEIGAKWVDPSDDSKAYHDFRDSKIRLKSRIRIKVLSTNCKLQ